MPLALLISNRWGWNAAFFLIVAVCTLVGAVIWAYLRPVDAHLKNPRQGSPLHHLAQTLSNRLYLQGFATTGLLSVGGFMLMPFMSVFMVHNLGLPITRLPLVYMLTGSCSIVSGLLIGRASDKFGKFRVFAYGCTMTIIMVTIYTHLHAIPLWELVVVMVLLQSGILSRIIASSALMSALPKPEDRGSYMSVSSSLQQVSGGIASVVAGLVVAMSPAGELLHFDTLGYVLIVTTLITLDLMYLIDRKIKGIQAAAAAAPKLAAVRELGR